MQFAHVSDLHLWNGPDAEPGVSAHTFAVTEAMVKNLTGLRDVLDFVVVSGDLTEDAHPDSFAQFERLFRSLGLPVFAIPGNHDGPAGYLHEARKGYLAECDITGRAVNAGGLRLVGINTCVEKSTTGAISGEDLDFVERELAKTGAQRPVIIMHHPPFGPGLSEFDAIAGLKGASDIATLFDSASVPPLVLSGHVHRAYQAARRGVTCYVAGCPAMPFTSDLPFGDSPIRPSREECRYFVHRLDASGAHVVTAQPFYLDGKSA